MRPRPSIVLFLLLFVLATSPSVWGLEFDLPLTCPEQGCLIQNYVDRDPGPGWMDYACGSLSYDGHNATDFRVSYDEMQAGVEVYAAAPGRVVAVRDDMVDMSMDLVPPEYVSGRGAGNVVVLDHGNGWKSHFAHLKQGSILVEEGQMVDKGQPLGLVGLSGQTSFPHLHFRVDFNGQVVCPFVGLGETKKCGLGTDPLWSPEALKQLAYPGAGVLKHGFSDQIPDMTVKYDWGSIKSDISARSPKLIYWVALYGVRKGDLLTIRILNPDGSEFHEIKHRLDKTQAQRIEYVGKKLSKPAWPTGQYEARCTLTRGAGSQAKVVVDARATVMVR